MQYIFIENYLQLSQKQKMSFFNFIEKLEKLKIINQEIIFEEEAIILKFDNESNNKSTQKIIQEYFTKNKMSNLNIEIVKKHNTKLNKTILTFIHTNKHILI